MFLFLLEFEAALSYEQVRHEDEKHRGQKISVEETNLKQEPLAHNHVAFWVSAFNLSELLKVVVVLNCDQYEEVHRESDKLEYFIDDLKAVRPVRSNVRKVSEHRFNNEPESIDQVIGETDR